MTTLKEKAEAWAETWKPAAKANAMKAYNKAFSRDEIIPDEVYDAYMQCWRDLTGKDK